MVRWEELCWRTVLDPVETVAPAGVWLVWLGDRNGRGTGLVSRLAFVLTLAGCPRPERRSAVGSES